jgi:hypothetical protein
MGRKERIMLDQLRERLSLPVEEAARIERDAARRVGSGLPVRAGLAL